MSGREGVSGSRVAELCRRLKPLLGRKIDVLWAIHMAETTPAGRAEIEQMLEALAAEHLGSNYELDRNPFPPPSKRFATAGELAIGQVYYAGRELYPLQLKADQLSSHLLICGRSGSGKTTAVFHLASAIMQQNLRLLAIDWKRSYRHLKQLDPNLRVYTVGRDVAPIRFNPLIPPAGCTPAQWLKLIIDVLSRAYVGGEGVISLLTKGLDALYRDLGVYDGQPQRWPTTSDLLAWLSTQKLTGRAAQWAASAERILLAMTYGDFAAVLNTQDNRHVETLLDQNVVLEMDGLASDTERSFFSEALMLYLYRKRLAEGPKNKLTNQIILEEAHHLLLAKDSGAGESMLEQTIRLVREYGIGFVFVDQSAHALSRTAFANTYATIALNQKLAADVRTMAGAMNLSDAQKQALTTLPVGQAVVKLADTHPEPFLIQVPPSPADPETVSDGQLRAETRNREAGLLSNEPSTSPSDSRSDSTPSAVIPPPSSESPVIRPVPPPDKEKNTDAGITSPIHPPPPTPPTTSNVEDDATEPPDPPADEHANPAPDLSREAIRFLADVAARPLSTTVQRYERLHLSRRRGNAIRQQLADAGLLRAVRLPTRSGQSVLQELTDEGRSLAERLEITVGPAPTTSLEHQYWAHRAAEHFEGEGYQIQHEYQVDGNGAVDLLVTRGDRRIGVEIETGKSDIGNNLTKAAHAGFEKTIVIATSLDALHACRRALRKVDTDSLPPIELMSWLDLA